jgi:hypothetical protein
MDERTIGKPGTPGGNFEYEPLNGALLLIDVIKVEDHIPTMHTKPGEKSPAVRCDLYVLDGAHAGDEHIDSLIFPKILQAQLRRSVGQRILGRLGQGERQPGKNPPWTLREATSGDYATADRWVASRRTVTSAQPVDEQPPF